jgi:hypothetical protein
VILTGPQTGPRSQRPPAWAHARYKFFDLARIKQGTDRGRGRQAIDALFAIEGEANGLGSPERIRPRQLNDVDPQAWLTDMLARLPDRPARRIADLLPWQWCGSRRQTA